MKLFRHFTDLPDDARGAVVALGNFDGLHRGHRIVIGAAADVAKASGAPLAVLTFEPHPRSLFRPSDAPFKAAQAMGLRSVQPGRAQKGR